MEILRDAVWQAVGAIVAIAAIVVSVVTIIRRRKSLSYEIESFVPLLSVRDELEGKLKITFGDVPVSKVHLAVIKIINTGYVPIVKEDFDEAIRIRFGMNSKLLTSSLSEKHPKDLPAGCEHWPHMVVLSPLLLNRKDSVTFKVMVSNADGVHVSGRIIGVQCIRQLKGDWVPRDVLRLTSGILLGLAVSLFGLALFADTQGTLRTLALLLTVLSISLCGLGAFRVWQLSFKSQFGE